MTTAPAIANARRPGQPMSDEQRRAMFARMWGGGSSGGHGSSRSWDEFNVGDQTQSELRAPTWKDTAEHVVHGLLGLGDVTTTLTPDDPAWKWTLGTVAGMMIPLPGGKARTATRTAASVKSLRLAKLMTKWQEIKAAGAAISPTAEKAAWAAKSKAVDFLSKISDVDLSELSKAYRLSDNNEMDQLLRAAPEARKMLRDFTTTPRKMLAREYGSPEALEKSLKAAREYRAANPGMKFMQDISDAALDAPVKSVWKDNLLADAVDALYDPSTRQVNLGKHLAFDAVLTKEKKNLVASAAHEFRHHLQEGMQTAWDKKGKLPYFNRPWEVEVRRGQLKAELQKATGRIAATPDDVIAQLQELGRAKITAATDWSVVDTAVRRDNSLRSQASKLIPGLLGLPLAVGVASQSQGQARNRAWTATPRR